MVRLRLKLIKICPNCLDTLAAAKDEFFCPNCGLTISKARIKQQLRDLFDPPIWKICSIAIPEDGDTTMRDSVLLEGEIEQ